MLPLHQLLIPCTQIRNSGDGVSEVILGSRRQAYIFSDQVGRGMDRIAHEPSYCISPIGLDLKLLRRASK